MLRKVVYFKNKIVLRENKNMDIKKNVGDVIIGEYLSIDRDGIHQYKLGGICIMISNKCNIQNIVLRQKLMSSQIDFCLNVSSPLLYNFQIVRKRLKKNRKLLR